MLKSCLVPEHEIPRVTKLCCRNPGRLSSRLRCLHNINVSVRQSQQELVSMNCSVSVGLLRQLLDEFAAVEAAVEVCPQ